MTEPWGDNWLLTYLVACRSAPGGAGKSRSKQRSCEVCLAQGSAESEDALTGVRSHEGLGEAEWRQQTELPEKENLELGSFSGKEERLLLWGV